jgi:hypothetical protein
VERYPGAPSVMIKVPKVVDLPPPLRALAERDQHGDLTILVARRLTAAQRHKAIRKALCTARHLGWLPGFLPVLPLAWRPVRRMLTHPGYAAAGAVTMTAAVFIGAATPMPGMLFGPHRQPGHHPVPVTMVARPVQRRRKPALAVPGLRPQPDPQPQNSPAQPSPGVSVPVPVPRVSESVSVSPPVPLPLPTPLPSPTLCVPLLQLCLKVAA